MALVEKDFFHLYNSLYCAQGRGKRNTYRIKLVLALHVMLYKHNVMNGLLQFERVFLPRRHIAQRFVQARHHRWKPVVAP